MHLLDLEESLFRSTKISLRHLRCGFRLFYSVLCFILFSSLTLMSICQVFLHTLATEQSLVNRISKFEAAFENGEKTSIRGLCEKKTEEAE